MAAMLMSMMLAVQAKAQDKQLILGSEGVTKYQVVLPDTSLSPEVEQSLEQAARLMQAAFKSNRFDLSVVKEAQHDPAIPGLYLGDTAMARKQGIVPGQHKDWGYVHRVAGQNVIIAGRDAPSPGTITNPSAPTSPVLGTVKGVADFLREYAGTRFVMPDVGARGKIASLNKVDLLTISSIEYLPTPVIAVPANLNVQRTPAIEYNIAWASGAGFYDIANCRFPIVDEIFGGHTWARAIPEAKYIKDHPEYFAFVNGKRLTGMGAGAQYCISNKDVQELLYQDLIRWLDSGYHAVDLGHPDGFRPCQCENCTKLFDTGNDWNEKIWILHRNLAQRVAQARPDKIVTIYSYIQTSLPPKTFAEFPANVRIALTGTEEHELIAWSNVTPPQGFSAYIYNWTPNLVTTYHPMRTPLYVEAQARRFASHHFHSIYRDGRGDLYGLEGPVYYIMGRMFDDPEKLQAKDLMVEYCAAAFGNSAPAMLRFYNELYHGIELYSQYLGTRAPGWSYKDIFGRGKKHLSDPLQMIAFLYPPQLLESLEKNLIQAEKSASSDKVNIRLALVRREFEWVRNLARAVHLYRAFEVQPDTESRDRVLDALEVRNAQIASLFDESGRSSIAVPGLAVSTYPPLGHNRNHMMLNYDGYQTPYKSTFLNWDVKAMRNAPLPGAKSLSVLPLNGDAKDAATWATLPTAELSALDEVSSVAVKTRVRATYDANNLYLRVEADFPAGKISEQETLEIYLWAPTPGSEVSYRFNITPGNVKADAANGFVTDAMDPRYGQYDPDWEGAWSSDVHVDGAAGVWVSLVTIPFKTIGVTSPEAGTHWRGNIGRVHVSESGKLQRSLWSASPSAKTLEDRKEFGELVFEASAEAVAAKLNPLLAWRNAYYAKTFEMVPAWKTLPDPLPVALTGWQFRTDAMEQGVKNHWFSPDAAQDGWLPAQVPAFWSEIPGVGQFQGYGWYRVSFNVPQAWAGRPITIGFGAADEQAWVYFNGQLVREHSIESEHKTINQLWEEAFVATVPSEYVKYGQTNVIVVRVLNAVANGGLWRPVVVHAAAKP